jgi:hypothetical protein
VELFEQGDTPLLLLSALAGGRGLNVPSATHMLFFDLPSTFRVYSQCRARALRCTRSPLLPLEVSMLNTPSTVEEGEYYALWARMAQLWQTHCPAP